MRNLLKQNKAFWAVIFLILISSLFIGIRFSDKKLTGSLYCPNLPQLQDNEEKLVTKVIDGDTFLIEGGYTVRILGIDADERGYPCYEPAKKRLEELILNKKVRMERDEENFDKYCRYLRYVFLDSEDIGLKLISEGLVVARVSLKDERYRSKIIDTEKVARESKIGCKWGLAEKKLSPDTKMEAINACEARYHYEEEMIVEGKVVSGYRSKTNTVFLNFEKPYPNQCFTAVIFAPDQYKFVEKPESYYENKVVRIRGQIKEYKGKAEIILKDPSQIEIVEQ